MKFGKQIFYFIFFTYFKCNNFNIKILILISRLLNLFCLQKKTHMSTRSGRHYTMLLSNDGYVCDDRQRCGRGPCKCFVTGVNCNFCTKPIKRGYPDDGGLKWGGEWKTPRRIPGTTWVGHVCWSCYLTYNVYGDSCGDPNRPACGDFARFLKG